MFPASHHWCFYDLPGGLFNACGHGDGYRTQRAMACIRKQRIGRLALRRQNGIGVLFGAIWNLLRGKNVPGKIAQGECGVGRGDVDGKDACGIGIELETLCRTASGGVGNVRRDGEADVFVAVEPLAL